MSLQLATERMERVTERLVERGVLDVKFFFGPDFQEGGLEKVLNDAAQLLESYLAGGFVIKLSTEEGYMSSRACAR